MKYLVTILATLALALGTSFAGCGQTITDTGKLKSVDKEAKKVTIEVAGKEVTREYTPSTTGAADLDGLKGKNVTIVSDKHTKKANSIAKG